MRVGRPLLLVLALALVHRPVAAQTDSAAVTVRESSWPILVFVVESTALGFGIAARSELGAQIAGSIQGISGLGLLGVAAFVDDSWPEFAVPYGLGLVTLSTYNFASAASRESDDRFWANFLGFNGTVIVAIASGVLSEKLWRSGSAISVHAGSSTVFARIRF
jgi:hypothetical protein